jgi:sphingomyelin phosphodiesterase acid-like 3
MRQNATFLISIVFAAASIACSGCSARKASKTAVTGNEVNTGKPYFLFLSDVHLATNREHTESNTDTGTDLWDTARRKIDSILNSSNPPAFILYTGDMPEHEEDGKSLSPQEKKRRQEQRKKNIITVLLNLHEMSAIKNTPVFYVPGNNDALEGNYCLFSDPVYKEAFSLVRGYSPYPYAAFNVSSTPAGSGAYMISGSNLAAGYYSAKAGNGLRIISLNSVIWSSQLMGKCPADAALQLQEGNKQMAWLEQQLESAASAGDKVYLAMHIPPGADAFLSKDRPDSPVMTWGKPGDGSGYWQNEFLQKISAYKNTVAGIFFGHTHMDEFRLLYDPAGDTVNQVAISCPAIAPQYRNNPGFKLVEFDAGSKLPVDFITYYARVNPVRWQGAYRFSELSMQESGTSIYGQLKKMEPAGRKQLLGSIYRVMNGTPANRYDTLGLDVK